MARHFGDAWFYAKTALALRVATILAPGEWTVLLNPCIRISLLVEFRQSRTMHLRCAIAAEPTEIQRSLSHGRWIWFRADRMR